MKIALGCDHRGFVAKQRIWALLESRGITIQDFGTNAQDSFDYPDAAIPASKSVASGNSDVGILCCGTGIGMSIAANKVKGVRASLCHDELSAEMARRHNNANVLCLPIDMINGDVIDRVVKVWLDTPFEGGRHERRISKISEFENHNGNGCC